MKAKKNKYAEYRSGMKAIYSKDHPPHYKGFPWLESQIPIHTREEIRQELELRAEFHRPERRLLSAGDRQDFLFKYRKYFFIVRECHIDLALQMKRTLFAQHHGINIFNKGLYPPSPVEEEVADTTEYDFEDADTPPSRNIVLIGESGSGKTHAIRVAARLFPQVIIHQNFHGRPLLVKQLNFLKIVCPATTGPKSAWTNFYESFNKVMKTNVSVHGLSEPRLQEKIGHDGRLHGLGFVWLDETQNVFYREKKAKEILATFTRFTELTGIPMVMTGTPELEDIIAGEVHSSRRVEGSFPWKVLSPGKEFDWFLREVFKRVLTRTELKWSEELSELFFEFSIGRVDFVIGLFIEAQRLVLEDGRESIKLSDLNKAKLSMYMTEVQRMEISTAREEWLEEQKKKEEEERELEGASAEAKPSSQASKKRKKSAEPPNDPGHQF